MKYAFYLAEAISRAEHLHFASIVSRSPPLCPLLSWWFRQCYRTALGSSKHLIWGALSGHRHVIIVIRETGAFINASRINSSHSQFASILQSEREQRIGEQEPTEGQRESEEPEKKVLSSSKRNHMLA